MNSKKIALLSIFATSMACSMGTMAKDDYSGFSPSEEKRLVRVCEAIQSDSKGKLNAALRSSRISYQQLSDGLVCNGMDAISFALHSGAMKNAELIAGRVHQDISRYAKVGS